MQKLILRKTSKIGATRYQYFKAKNAPESISTGPPGPVEGAYSVPPDPLTVFNGPTFRGGRGRGEKEKRQGKGKKRGRGAWEAEKEL